MLYKSLIRGEFLEWFFKPFFKPFNPLSLIVPVLGSIFSSKIEGEAAEGVAQQDAATSRYGVDQRRKTALDQLLAGLDVGRSGQRRALDQYGRSMADFRQDTTGTPTQISKLQELIRQQALPEQRRAMSQGRLALQQQGVRGPESALMQQMQANTMQKSLANRAQQVALQQQLRDRERRAELAASQAGQALPGSIAGTTNYKPKKRIRLPKQGFREMLKKENPFENIEIGL
tara:strand:+ start:78 stop:770 length:693 start_codon:yes stop_codon:yes gene_type:complete